MASVIIIFGDYRRLGKKCYLGEDCTHFSHEQEEESDERGEDNRAKE
jgi:hypothetical protein